MSTNAAETKALELLALNFSQEEVASAVGLSPGRISQLISDPEFASQLATQRFDKLKKHNVADNELDEIEDSLRQQLKRVMPLAMKPMEVTRMLQSVNAMKRRGATAPQSAQAGRPVVSLRINAAILHRFAVNGANQVVEATTAEGTQSLVTIQSGGVQRLLNEQAKQLSHEKQPVLTPTQRNAALEREGIAFRTPQGRNKVDVLSECGFAHEIEISSSQGNEQ